MKKFYRFFVKGLVLLFVAACFAGCGKYAVNENPPRVPETENKEPGSSDKLHTDPELENGGIISDPIEIVLPSEEKETELELILTFPIGKDGLFSYHWQGSEDGDPERWYIQSAPTRWCADEEGNFYVVLVEQGDREGAVLRLNDGKLYERAMRGSPLTIWCAGKKLYVETDQCYSENEKFMTLDTESGLWETLVPPDVISGKSFTLVMCDGDAYWYNYEAETYYSLSGERLSEEGFSCTTLRTDGENGEVTFEKDGVKRIFSGCGVPDLDWSARYEDNRQIICCASRHNNNVNITDVSGMSESIYCWFDASGHLIAECMETTVRYNEQPWEFSFSYYGEEQTIKWFEPQTVTLGSSAFEETVRNVIFFGPDGTMYFVVYYLDHGEIYKVCPGYEKTAFTEKNAHVDS